MIDRRIVGRSFVYQHDMTDCGAACLLSLIKYYGGDSSILHLREISGTSNTGTTLLGMYQAAVSMGFDAQGAEANGIPDLIEHGKPCILSVIVDKVLSHYIVCFGYENEKFLISDPAQGVIEMTADELSEIWTRKCLLLEPNEKFERKESIEGRKKSWALSLIRDDFGILGSSAAIGVVIAILSMVMAVFSQKLVDDVLPSGDKTKLIAGLILVLFLLLAKVFINALRSKLLITQSKDFNNRIIRFFFNKILHLPKNFFDTRKTGDMVARLNDTRRIQTVINTIVGDTVINVLMLVVSIVFLFIYSWKVALIALLFMPLFYWIIARNNKRISLQQRDVMSAYAMTESGFINTIGGIPDIKNFSKQDVFLRINEYLYSAFQEKNFILGKTGISIGISAGVSSTLIQIGLIALCSVFVINGDMTTGVLMAVISITGTLFSTITSLALIMIPINEARVAFDRMYEIVDAKEDENVSADKQIEVAAADLLVLKDIAFRFIGRKRILENVSFSCSKGSITSIVGESGCGKSTLCQVLQRFYNPEEGLITLDGTNINDFPIEHWRSLISVVPQDIYIYNGTVLENICFGEMPKDLNEVVIFLQKYGFVDFINELPNGLATLVGEEGINLSGGQKQLIAFARALYKPGRIFILDEMTAAMDRRTEKHICRILTELKKDHIIVFVTHRLETAKLLSDKIIVMENGHITAKGSHDELMMSDNFYSEYWKSLI